MTGADLVPGWAWTVLPVLASAYGFSQSQAKTDDGFFLGFPSYWNVVALYAWLLVLAPGWTAALLVVLSVAVFVPIKYIYPSQMPVLQKSTHLFGALWFAGMLFAVVNVEGALSRPLAQVSLLFPVWYLALSFWHGGLLRSRAA